MGGVVERICDGTWVMPGKRAKCYEKGKAAEVLWDYIPDIGLSACRSIEPFEPQKWNQDCLGAWRRDLGGINYGI